MRRRGVDSNEEGPILERTSPSNLVERLEAEPDETILPQTSPVYTTPTAASGLGYRRDYVPLRLYQPSSGSNPTGSGGQKVSSGMLITALQTSIRSSRRQDVMTFFGSGSCLPGYNI